MLSYILLENIIWKVVYIIKFYLQFLCAAGYLKHSGDPTKLNILNIQFITIEICINRLSTTTQIFIAIDYLIMMSEKYLYFRKRKKYLARTFFPTPIFFSCNLENFFELYVFQKYVQKLERNWNNSGCIKVDNFLKSVNF